MFWFVIGWLEIAAAIGLACYCGWYVLKDILLPTKHTKKDEKPERF